MPYAATPYAGVADMVARYGQLDMVRMSTPEGADMGDVVAGRVLLALTEASGKIDSYFRRRYVVPVANVTPEIVAACCALARYSLSFGGQLAPSEEVRLQNKDAIAWLDGVAAGRVTLDGIEVAGPNSFPMVSDRAGHLSAQGGMGCGFGWPSADEFWP